MASRVDQVDSKKDVNTESNAMSDWDYVEVAKLIHDAMGSKVEVECRNLARHLKVYQGKRPLNLETIRKSMLHDKKEPLEVMEQILDSWKENNGANATIPVLVKELKNMDLLNVSEKLAAAFGMPDLK